MNGRYPRIIDRETTIDRVRKRISFVTAREKSTVIRLQMMPLPGRNSKEDPGK